MHVEVGDHGHHDAHQLAIAATLRPASHSGGGALGDIERHYYLLHLCTTLNSSVEFASNGGRLLVRRV